MISAIEPSLVFSQAVHLTHTIDISDSRLKKVSEKILDQVAIDLLQQFPLNANFPTIRSKKLKERISYFRALFVHVATATFGKTPLVSLACVMQYLKGYSYYSTNNPSTVLEQLRRNALMSLDLVYSFPERYFQPKKNEGVLVKTFLDCVGDKERDLQREYARFFYKQIALFQKDEKGNMLPIPWAKLVEQWVGTGGKIGAKFVTSVRKLPYAFLYETVLSGNEDSEETFRDFVYRRSVEELEKGLEVQFAEEIRANVIEKMQEESFRSDLVFYTGFLGELLDKKIVASKSAKPFLKGLRLYFRLKAHYSWPEGYRSLLLTWCIKATHGHALSKELKDKEKKKGFSLQNYIVAVQPLSGSLIPEDFFPSYALEILLLMVNNGVAHPGHLVGNLCNLNWDSYDLSVEKLLTFFRKNELEKIELERANAVAELLGETKAKGTSNLVLDAYASEIELSQIQEVAEILKGLKFKELTAQQVLSVLLFHANNSQYIDLFQEQFQKLSKEEQLLFRCIKHPPVEAARNKDQPLSWVRELEEAFSLSPKGSFDAICALVHEEDTHHYKNKVLTLKRAEAFANAPLKQDLVSKLMGPEIDLNFLDALIDLYELFRQEIGTHYLLETYLPEDLIDRIRMKGNELIESASSVVTDMEALTELYFIQDHLNSGLFCRDPSGLTDLIEKGPKEGAAHVFAPFGEAIGKERMILAGWRVEDHRPILDVALVHTPTMKTQGFCVKLPFAPSNADCLYPYLGALASHHLAELHGTPIPNIPESLTQNDELIQIWVKDLKKKFRRATLELSSQTPLGKELLPGQFSLPFDLSTNGYEVKDCSEKGETKWKVEGADSSLTISYPRFLVENKKKNRLFKQWQIALFNAFGKQT